MSLRVASGMVFRFKWGGEELYTILQVEEDWFSYLVGQSVLVWHVSMIRSELSSNWMLVETWEDSYALLLERNWTAI